MTREEIKKQWELEFGAKYEEYQRANVYTATDILDFAESVVNKLLISGVSCSSDGCYECSGNNLRPKEYNCLDCGHDGYCY